MKSILRSLYKWKTTNDADETISTYILQTRVANHETKLVFLEMAYLDRRWSKSGSKAFGVSFADRPKAKTE